MDSDLAFISNVDPDPAFHSNADPDPAFLSYVDPDSSFLSNADPDPASLSNANPDLFSIYCGSMQIRIRNPAQTVYRLGAWCKLGTGTGSTGTIVYNCIRVQYPSLMIFCYFSSSIVEESILSLGVDAQVTDSCAALNNRYI